MKVECLIMMYSLYLGIYLYDEPALRILYSNQFELHVSNVKRPVRTKNSSWIETYIVQLQYQILLNCV